MGKLRDFFTYPGDISGRRKVRTYIRVTFFILVALIVFLAVALYQQAQERRAMTATKPVVVEPSPTFTPIAQPTPTITPAEACPLDPSDWTMADTFPDDVFKRIEPVCVYDGLARAVAWALAIHEGYSRQAAADALGFDEFPMVRMNQVTIATNLQGPMPVEVYYVPPVPNFTEWFFDGAGEPAVSFALRGCFRTFTIVGNEKQDWGDGYPVVCKLSMDVEAINVLMCLDGHCYTTPYPPARLFVLYGYMGNGNWTWLGTQNDLNLDIDDAQGMQSDRLAISDLHGIVPWDAAWLTQTYQLEMQSLPENWQGFTDDAEIQAIMSAINSYLAGETSP